jgi:hypothetical protein
VQLPALVQLNPVTAIVPLSDAIVVGELQAPAVSVE